VCLSDSYLTPSKSAIKWAKGCHEGRRVIRPLQVRRYAIWQTRVHGLIKVCLDREWGLQRHLRGRRREQSEPQERRRPPITGPMGCHMSDGVPCDGPVLRAYFVMPRLSPPVACRQSSPERTPSRWRPLYSIGHLSKGVPTGEYGLSATEGMLYRREMKAYDARIVVDGLEQPRQR
jgi:hypothetical protein